MLDIFREMLAHPILQRAVVVGVLVSLCAALLGVSLVLKRYSMIGDGLSHGSSGALAGAAAAGRAPLPACIAVTVAAAFLLMRISARSRISGDAAIAVFSTTALAAGVLVTALTTGMSTDVYSYMFGSILAIKQADVVLSVVLCAAVLLLFLLFYHKIFAVTFDENFARATGTPAGAYNTLIALLTAVTIVLGMRIMGALLISSLIIFPALTAMRVCKRWKTVVLCAAGVSVTAFLTGLAVSYALDTPAGASIVAVNAGLFSLFWVVGAVRGRNRN